MTVQRVSDKGFGSRQVALLAREGLYRVARAIDGTLEIHPATAHPDVSFINVPLASDRAFPPANVRAAAARNERSSDG